MSLEFEQMLDSFWQKCKSLIAPERAEELKQWLSEKISNSEYFSTEINRPAQLKHLFCEFVDYAFPPEDETNDLNNSNNFDINQTENKNEIWYKELIETANEGILVIDTQSLTSFVNQKMANILGYQKEEMLGKPLFDFMDEEGVKLANQNIERRKQGIEEQHDFQFLKKDGSIVWTLISTNPIQDKNGDYLGAIAMITDITERKQTELELLKSKLFNESITQNVPAIITVYEVLTGRYQFVNTSFSKILGYESEEILSKGVIFVNSLIHPEDKLRIDAEISEAMSKNSALAPQEAKQRTSIFEYRIRHKSGAWVWLKTYAIIFSQTSSGKTKEVLNISQDITEQKIAEASLRSSEEKYRILVDMSPSAIVVHRQGKIIFANPITAKMIKAPHADFLLGKEVMSFVHPDYQDVAKQRMKQMFVEQLPVESFEEKFICLDGSTIDVEVSGSPINFNGLPAIQIVFNDITARKDAERKLNEAELKYKQLVADVKAILWKVGLPDNKSLFISQEAEIILGYPLDIWFQNANPWQSIVHPEDFQNANQIRQKGIDNKETYTIEYRAYTQSGKMIWLQDIVQVIVENGQAKELVGISLDITEKKQAETELNKALKELSERNFELDQLVYKISHDLRSPLSTILGLVNIFKLEDNPLKQEEYLNYIENRVHKLDGFVKSMLNYAKANRSEVQAELIDFEEIIKSCLFDLEYLENFKKLKVNYQIDKNAQNFQSDKLRLQIIFSNIISNAYKYMNLNAKSNYLKINIQQEKKILKIRFADNGIGIGAEHLSKVFDMFFRATTKSDGSGLGMYIVKQTIERLAGQIKIESKIGEGTHIYIQIPI